MILSAGAVVVRKDSRGWRFLFLRAYRNWDFPKGEVKPGERPLSAARREVREETGLKDLSFPWGLDFKETEPYLGGRKIARYYLARTESAEVRLSAGPELGRPEHNEYRWLSSAQLARLAPERLKPVIAWARGRLKRK
jgi:8-oxo-dGTP pyrophosphatase MutT (NUDIX family)